MYECANEYVFLCFYQVLFNYVVNLERKYIEWSSLSFIFESIKKDMVYEAAGNRLIVAWQSYAQQENLADSRWPDLPAVKAKARDVLDEMRSQLDRADYLFLSIPVTEDDKEGDLLKEEDFISSRNVMMRIVGCLACQEEEIIMANLNRLREELSEQCIGTEYHDLFELVSLVHDFPIAPEKVEISRLQHVLTLEPVYAGLLYALFRDAMEKKVDSQKLLDIMNGVDLSKSIGSRYFDILKCHLWHETGDLNQALRVIEKINLETLCDDDLIDCLSLKGKLYHATGQHGKAILTWEDIVKNEDFGRYMNENYYEALIQLASAKAVAGNPAEARQLLGAYEEEVIRKYCMDFMGSEYYVMCGNIYLAENNREKAVKMYNRSLAIADNPELRKKVKLVEMDLL